MEKVCYLLTRFLPNKAVFSYRVYNVDAITITLKSVNYKMTICRNFVKLTTGIFSAATLLSVLSCPQVKAQEVNSRCNNATISGEYGLQDTGTRKVNDATVFYDAVRTANFDAEGNQEGSGFLSIDGNISAYTVTGTYQVASDCKFTLDGTQVFDDGTTVPYKQFGVVVGGGKEILVLQTTNNRNQAGKYQRVSDY